MYKISVPQKQGDSEAFEGARRDPALDGEQCPCGHWGWATASGALALEGLQEAEGRSAQDGDAARSRPHPAQTLPVTTVSSEVGWGGQEGSSSG